MCRVVTKKQLEVVNLVLWLFRISAERTRNIFSPSFRLSNTFFFCSFRFFVLIRFFLFFFLAFAFGIPKTANITHEWNRVSKIGGMRERELSRAESSNRKKTGRNDVGIS